jgi:hypothetical protein
MQAGANPPLVFEITRQEKAVLLATLRLFPVLKPSDHQLTKTAKTAGAAEQRLLEESMVQQRSEHKKKLERFFRANEPFFKTEQGALHLTLTGAQLEWLLQVLNDIRVGSWVQLGCPELEPARRLELAREYPVPFTAMETSGYFQSALLEAVK